MRVYSFVSAIGITLTSLAGVSSQQTICSCSPSIYEFTFDFDLFCPPINIPNSDAVDDAICLVSPFDDNVPTTDLVPVAVSSITFLELAQDLTVLTQAVMTGNFVDGDAFQFTSAAAFPEDLTVPDDIPSVIQFIIVGENQAGEALLNTFSIAFTNSCDAFPVLEIGQSAGWTVFTNFELPRIENCPNFGIPGTESPSSAPTIAPVMVTPNPTKMPTNAPTKMPTNTPTKMPTNTPTKMPTNTPTKKPTNTPTKNPTNTPTITPSELPTIMPTKSGKKGSKSKGGKKGSKKDAKMPKGGKKMAKKMKKDGKDDEMEDEDEDEDDDTDDMDGGKKLGKKKGDKKGTRKRMFRA